MIYSSVLSFVLILACSLGWPVAAAPQTLDTPDPAADSAPAPPLAETPIYITADQAEFEQAQHQVIYTGQVHITQGALQLWADQVTALYDPVSGQFNFLLATGQQAKLIKAAEPDATEASATPDQSPLVVLAQRIEYWPQQQQIDASGQAQVSQQQSVIHSEVIRYNLGTQALSAESSRSLSGNAQDAQVQWVIQPNHLPNSAPTP